jgi:predicted DNA-binding transcriptional regulator AlpA
MQVKKFRPKDLAERYGVSRQTINNWERRGFLPPRKRYGPNCVAWDYETIIEFERSRPIGIAKAAERVSTQNEEAPKKVSPAGKTGQMRNGE